MRRNSWRALLIALLLLPMAARADTIARHAMSMTGSERLGLFAMTRMFDNYGQDPRVGSALRAALTRQGFYYDGAGSRVLSHGLWLSPKLGHDSNINGGMVNDRFGFGGLIFHADPSVTAKSGLVGGLAFGQSLRLAVANGTILDLTGRGEIEYSPRHDIGANRARISACLRHNLAGWTFADLCRDMQDNERKLGRSRVDTTRLALSTMTETGSAYHEITASLERSDYGYMDQDGVSFALRTAFDRAMPQISVFLAEPVAGELAFRRRIDAGITFLRRDRTFGMHLWAQEADGGRFLGTERRDLNLGLRISADLTRTTSIDISYARNKSTQQFFDYGEVSVAVGFRQFSW